jgi:hypothetical protein
VKHTLDTLNSRRPGVDADLFPAAVEMIDGVPMFLNASDDYDNGKKKPKYLSMQALVDMNGDPVWSGPPLEGRGRTAPEKVGNFPLCVYQSMLNNVAPLVCCNNYPPGCAPPRRLGPAAPPGCFGRLAEWRALPVFRNLTAYLRCQRALYGMYMVAGSGLR